MKETPHQREIFTATGKEPEKVSDKRAKDFIDEWIKLNGSTNIPEWEEFFQKIDFNLIKSLFSETARVLGISDKQMNFVEKERIISTNKGANRYYPEMNVITMGDPLEGYDLYGDRKFIVKYYGSVEIGQLRRLIHEETHAVCKNICREWIENFTGAKEPHYPSTTPLMGKMIFLQSGFHRTLRDPKNDDALNLFNLLNEGTVEKFAREVLNNYLTASGWPHEETEVYRRTLEKKPGILRYSDAVSLVNLLIKKISKITQLPEKTVWETFKRALMEGEKFENPELKQLFEETFGPDFLNELSALTIYTFDDAVDFLNKYNLKE